MVALLLEPLSIPSMTSRSPRLQPGLEKVPTSRSTLIDLGIGETIGARRRPLSISSASLFLAAEMDLLSKIPCNAAVVIGVMHIMKVYLGNIASTPITTSTP
jgi:hypothetical protein